MSIFWATPTQPLKVIPQTFFSSILNGLPHTRDMVKKRLQWQILYLLRIMVLVVHAFKLCSSFCTNLFNWLKNWSLCITTWGRDPIIFELIQSRERVLTPTNSELTKVKTESTRDKHTFTCPLHKLQKHIHSTISIYNYIVLYKSKGLYKCNFLSTTTYANTMQGD